MKEQGTLEKKCVLSHTLGVKTAAKTIITAVNRLQCYSCYSF